MRRLYLALLVICAASACDLEPSELAASGPRGAKALFEVPSTGEPLVDGFFSLPYPNDLRLTDTGKIDVSTLPVPNALLGDYIESIAAEQQGFGLTSAIFFRFQGQIDSASLPSEALRSQTPDASVYLVNLNRESANYGRKLPIETKFTEESAQLIGDNWLSCLPYPGFVMEEGTTYALVLSKRLRAEDGTEIEVSEEFAETMSREPARGPRLAHAQEVYAPLTAYLDEEGGDEREDVVNAAVFTTQRPTELFGRFRKVIREELETPVPRDFEWFSDRNGYAIYRGRYDSPHFQAGNFPYKTLAQGGGFEIDPLSGDPVLQRINDLRFSMTIPTDGEMPSEGWPIVVYAHGTGGDYLTYERNGTAGRMAAQGIAVISIDQVMHGDRLQSGDPAILFFNFQNPLASRANVLQAALEDFQLVRLAGALDVPERHLDGRRIRFDSSKIFFFGHSQGSVTGVPFAAYEPLIKGAVFSGAGGLLYLTMLSKTQPFDVTAILALIIRDPVIDRFHPALALLQAFYEPADAIVYARLLVQSPVEGNAPKNIFQPLGFGDSYTPVPTIEALATAFGADLIEPELASIEGLQLAGKSVLPTPVTNNAGQVTCVVAEYQPPTGSDGHFVSFDVAAARVQTTQFIKSLADTGSATVVDL